MNSNNAFVYIINKPWVFYYGPITKEHSSNWKALVLPQTQMKQKQQELLEEW
jgi:hypothetical protein